MVAMPYVASRAHDSPRSFGTYPRSRSAAFVLVRIQVPSTELPTRQVQTISLILPMS